MKMAKGWESKAIADQVEEASSKRTGMDKHGVYDTATTIHARGAQLETLRMSRVRTLEQLTRATNPHHRTMLENALQALDAKIIDAS